MVKIPEIVLQRDRVSRSSREEMDGPDTLHITGAPLNALFRVFVIINVSQKLFRKIQCLGDAPQAAKVVKN